MADLTWLVNILQPQFSEHFLSERGGKFIQWFHGLRHVQPENEGVQLVDGELA